MPDKQIRQYTEDTNPDEESDFLLQDTSNLYRKSKIKNFLKRLFTFDDVYDDYLVSGLNLVTPGGSSSPTLLNFRNNIWLYAFEDTPSVQEGFFDIHIKHDIKANTDITFHIHWTHNIASPSGNIKWNIEYTFAKGYEAGTFFDPVTVSTIQTAGAQYAHHITDDDDMVITAPHDIEPDTILIARIYRDSTDGSDTFASDAFLLHVDMHYVKARTGTKERNRPFTSGGF